MMMYATRNNVALQLVETHIARTEFLGFFHSDLRAKRQTKDEHSKFFHGSYIKYGNGLVSGCCGQEIAVWRNLAHDHVLQFLGANAFGEHPYVVSPYCRNGNALNYLKDDSNSTVDKVLLVSDTGLIFYALICNF